MTKFPSPLEGFNVDRELKVDFAWVVLTLFLCSFATLLFTSMAYQQGRTDAINALSDACEQGLPNNPTAQ